MSTARISSILPARQSNNKNNSMARQNSNKNNSTVRITNIPALLNNNKNTAQCSEGRKMPVLPALPPIPRQGVDQTSVKSINSSSMARLVCRGHLII